MITALLGIAGILGTLLAPLLTERMRREGAKREQLRSHRIDTYSDLLKVSARFADNTMTWASLPLADLPETDNDELDVLFARARVVARNDVYKQLRELTSQVHTFSQKLWNARAHARILQRDGRVDDGWAIKQRLELGDVAKEIREAYLSLEAAIRREFA